MYMYMDCIYHKSGVQCFIVRFNCSLDCSRAAHTLALATIIHALDIPPPPPPPHHLPSPAQGLRLLDPSGVVLERVCDPVRAYLHCREDTVRCIVASLTDNSSNELADVGVACRLATELLSDIVCSYEQ